MKRSFVANDLLHGPGIVAGVCSVLVSLSLGCRAKIDVQTKSGGPANLDSPLPPAGPVKRSAAVQQEPDKVLLPVKQVYQSREVLRIRVSKDMIAGATNVSLLNVTGFTAETEDNAPVVLDNAAMPTGLGLTSAYDGEGLGLAGISNVKLTLDSEGLVISIMPSQSEIRKLIKYGVNKLKILVITPTEDRYTYATVTLRDFDVLGPLMAHFVGEDGAPVGRAADGSQFQGWLNVVSSPVVAAKEGDAIKGTLAHGVFNMIQ